MSSYATPSPSFRVAKRLYVFRHGSPEAYLDRWWRCCGPRLKTFDVVGEAGREALESDPLDLIARFNRTDDGTMVVPSGYLEAAIVKR